LDHPQIDENGRLVELAPRTNDFKAAGLTPVTFGDLTSPWLG